MSRSSWPPRLVWPPMLFLAALLAYPLALTFTMSFHSFTPTGGVVAAASMANYQRVLGDAYYLALFADTMRIGLTATLCCLLLGFPLAGWVHSLTGRARTIVTFIVLAPLMISVAIRTLGWIIILSDNGVVNGALLAFGLIDRPIRLLYTEFAVILGLTEALLPFMVLALLASLQAIPAGVLRAASICGAGPITVFLRVVLPLCVPGIAAGCLLVFAIATSSFITPRILGGGTTKMIANVIVEQFMVTLNWPFGAAIAFVLLALVFTMVATQHALTERMLARQR